jgi:hypothetical protein
VVVTGRRTSVRGRAAALGLVLAATLLATPPPAAGETTRTITYEVTQRGDVRADLGEFQRAAGAILGDERGWSLGGSLRFVEVPSGGQLSLVLASPQAVADAASDCSRFYSCRVGREVLVNDRNWRVATPGWRAADGGLLEYRRYVITHEVGHFLGFGHVGCPRRGAPAPVMMQQSKGLEGCVPSGWPTRGERQELAARYGVQNGWAGFTDVPDGGVHTAAIDDAADRGIVTGYPDGSYRPAEQVTREQVASFLARSLGLRPVGSSPFSDVADRSVHADAITALAEAGIARGDRDGTYRPEERVTRAQVASLLARAYGLRPASPATYSDVPPRHPHAVGIAAAEANGITTGHPDGAFRPDERVRRDQVATLVIRARQLDRPHTPTPR